VDWRRDEQAHAQGVNKEDNYYWYDGLYQVKERQRGNLTGTAPNYTGIGNLQQKEDWTYDATGNWAAYADTNPANSQTRTHNKANEITQIASATVTPGYDPAGNMLTLPRNPGGGTAQYALKWDAWNRLVSVKDGGTNVASYTYDGLTRRLTKTIPTSGGPDEIRHYYYNDQWRAVEERVEGASATVDHQYVWGLRDRWDLLRRKRSVSGGSLNETHYILRDYLDPVALADPAGNIVERYAYDAFGNVRFLQPNFTAWSDGFSHFAWDFLFHSEFQDADAKLYNYGYRCYDTRLGRWLSRDPNGENDGLNLYGIVENEPLNGLDALGLESTRPCKGSKKPLKIGMRGLNPDPSNPNMVDGAEEFYDGGKGVAQGSGLFYSKQDAEAIRYIINYFDRNGDGKLTKEDCPPFRVRLVGYSWGAWTALGIAHKLDTSNLIEDKAQMHLSIGTVDPVSSYRSHDARNKNKPTKIKIVKALNYYQTNGIESGMPNSLFKGEIVSWAVSRDASLEPPFGNMGAVEVGVKVKDKSGNYETQKTKRIGHMGIIKKYGPTVVKEIFNHK